MACSCTTPGFVVGVSNGEILALEQTKKQMKVKATLKNKGASVLSMRALDLLVAVGFSNG